MLKNRLMVSIPSDNPDAYRKALKLVAAKHGSNIGKLIHEILMNSEYGGEFKASFENFVAESGNKNPQTDTIGNKQEVYEYDYE